MKLIRHLLSNSTKRRLLLLLVCLLSNSAFEATAQTMATASPGFEGKADLPEAPAPVRLFQASPATVTAQPQTAQHPTHLPNYPPMKVREKLFIYDLIGPEIFLVTGVQAGVDQGRTLKVPYPSDGFVGPDNHPAHGAIPEWEKVPTDTQNGMRRASASIWLAQRSAMASVNCCRRMSLTTGAHAPEFSRGYRTLSCTRSSLTQKAAALYLRYQPSCHRSLLQRSR